MKKTRDLVHDGNYVAIVLHCWCGGTTILYTRLLNVLYMEAAIYRPLLCTGLGIHSWQLRLARPFLVPWAPPSRVVVCLIYPKYLLFHFAVDVCAYVSLNGSFLSMVLLLVEKEAPHLLYWNHEAYFWHKKWKWFVNLRKSTSIQYYEDWTGCFPSDCQNEVLKIAKNSVRRSMIRVTKNALSSNPVTTTHPFFSGNLWRQRDLVSLLLCTY